MRTAYDALRRAIIKDFGKWYAFEWDAVVNETKNSIKQGLANKHFSNPFLTNLSNLYIDSINGYMRGKQSGGYDFGEEYEKNLEMLKVPFIFHWWVFSSFDFDDWFELRGFRSKIDAVEFLKLQKKREDCLFYTFMYRW